MIFAKELYKKAFDRLKLFSTEPETETKFILKKLFNIDKLSLVLNKRVENENSFLELDNILQKREKRIPLQYIFNEQQFRNYDLYVDERVLIPRPETELLVETVIDISRKYFFGSPEINIVDVGTGSGAISISLALEIKKAKVYTTDISSDALQVAKININKLNVPDNKITLINGDKLEPFKGNNINKKFDIIVSNPPYIPYSDYINLEKEVINNEPKIALLNETTEGLGFYEYFAYEGHKFLNSGGFMAFETGYNQAEKIAKILLSQQKFDTIEIIKDYNNISRIVTARQKHENFTG